MCWCLCELVGVCAVVQMREPGPFLENFLWSKVEPLKFHPEFTPDQIAWLTLSLTVSVYQ